MKHRLHRIAGALLLQCATLLPGVAVAQARELAVCSDPANLPYSDDRLQGYENRIADLLAKELGGTPRYTWHLQRRSFLRRTLQAGSCDVVIGAPAGLRGLTQTRPYYTSTYVFVTRRDRGLDLAGFDDARLRGLRIGLQAVGADGANTPPAASLARRGITTGIVGFPVWGEDEQDLTPQSRVIDAVARGDIDVAIVWGPIAGWFARQHGALLQLAPASDDIPGGPAFRYGMAVGVRRGDEILRDELQAALDRRGNEIQAILKSYGVPLVDPPPVTSASNPLPRGQ